MSNIAVIIIAKNEEKFISKTIDSLINQKLKPHRIIVVDDGSDDKTSEIALQYKNVEVIKRKNRKEFLQTKKELAETTNVGLEKLRDDISCEFVMKLDADITLPKNYISDIITKMESNPKIAVSSGVIEGEHYVTPRGAGRVVRMDFWRKIGLRYPVNYGFEGYLLVKAMSMGYQVKVFNDLIFQTLRKTGSDYNPKLYYYYGLGMKSTGYTFVFALHRILKFAMKKPMGAYYMLRGFLSNYDNLYEKEVREYTRNYQYRKLRSILGLNIFSK
ncbi:MAG: glycosyltransferase family 2 protein [Nitrosopumilus sp.]|nr:glycosyltransferase family 2 protein [Nitrosopumilus sp.]